jgi:hypothetical protein
VTRLHADPVEVLRHDTGLGPEPAQFLWRGRLYLVRDVLARWTESGGWWRTPAVRALTSGDGAVRENAEPDPLETAPIPPSPKWSQRAWGEPAPDVGAAVSGLSGVDDGERSWWRVEAARGMSGGTGVYDLCLHESEGTWALARVLD